MANLFAYGTLMCVDIMEEVSGCRPDHVDATLKGYSGRSIIGEHYPGIIPQKAAWVGGVLYRNVPESALERLDRFEGEMYSRQLVEIELDDGRTLPAAAYVVRPEFRSHVDQSEWEFTEFLRHGKVSFQSNYKGYESL